MQWIFFTNLWKFSYPAQGERDLKKVQTQLARLIDLTETKVRYDAQVKKVLANEAILVWILKTCVDEFSFCSLYEIAECIKGTPEISASAVHPVDPDAEETGEQINSDRHRGRQSEGADGFL